MFMAGITLGCGHGGAVQTEHRRGSGEGHTAHGGRLIGLDNHVPTPCKGAFAQRGRGRGEIKFVVKCATSMARITHAAFYISAETGPNERRPIPNRITLRSFAHMLATRGVGDSGKPGSCERAGSVRLLVCGVVTKGKIVMSGDLTLASYLACNAYVSIIAIAQGGETLRLKQLFDGRPRGCESGA